jgi:HAD superfamily hydrolase (TIGR01662 family)
MLYIFDLDGTLVEKYGIKPLPNVQYHLEQLASNDHHLAIATNQAGLAWRILTMSTKFPDVLGLAQRFEQIAQDLPQLQNVPWFISVFDSRVKIHPNQYQEICSELADASPNLLLIVQAVPEWRKPNSGMLLAGAKYYKIHLEDVIFVGDYKTDMEAAEAAGVKFFWAETFFSDNFERQ